MKLFQFLFANIVVSEKSGNQNKFLPDCHAGEYRVSEIPEYEKHLGDEKLNWSKDLDHQWGACVMQGHRNHMEDRTITRSHFYSELKSVSLYIVFDGHGGDEVANHAKAEFADYIIEEGKSIFKEMEDFSKYDEKSIEKLFYSAFPAWDRELMHKKDIHKKLLDPKTRSTSGCTCTGVLLTPQHIIVFNVGDSRTLILNENHKENDMILFATKDHKPDDPEETARIEKSGGFVTLPPRTYIPRVNGQLALSRAFGDFQLKMSKTAKQHEQAVIVDPDVTIFKRSEATHIVVASDGIYDGLSNEEIAKIAVSDETEERRSFTMLRASLANESSDNMAAIVIDLNKKIVTDENDTDDNTEKDEL